MNYLIPCDEITALWLQSLTNVQKHALSARLSQEPIHNVDKNWIKFKRLLNMGPE